MFSRLLKYKKFNELFDPSNLETIISIILIFLIIIIFERLNIYENILQYIEALKNIAIYIAAALIGLLGVILAGISIIISSLNNNNMRKIEEINGEGTIESILCSFEFLAFIVGIQIITFFMLYLYLYTTNMKITKMLFYILVIIIAYVFIFSIFYTVSLVGNCIQFFFISKIYDDIDIMEKRTVEILNQIEIEFILTILCDRNNIDRSDIITDLREYINEQEIQNKEEIIKYFDKIYYN